MQFAPLIPKAIDVEDLMSSRDENNDPENEAIKCFCGYNDDDGNTVFCETCCTWGHIECYYPDGIVPEVHECVDCRPRFVDAEGAKERQRQSRGSNSSSHKEFAPSISEGTKYSGRVVEIRNISQNVLRAVSFLTPRPGNS